MRSFDNDGEVISINRTVAKNADIIRFLPACHVISGCDTVPQMHGIGKGKAIGALKNGPLVKFMDEKANKEEFMPEAKAFVARCYGCSNISSSENRQRIWEAKTGKAKITGKAKSIELKSLPPTDECLELNILHARYQLMIWQSCLDGSPPNMDPSLCGWMKDAETKILAPMLMPRGSKTAPDEVIKSISCNCGSSQCKTLACGCAKSGIACSQFCSCFGKLCLNKWTEQEVEDSDDES